jgi:hypothetical protein
MQMFEADNQRYKLQLQALNGDNCVASGGDYEIAVKELKAMQEQLDASHQEVQRLKNQLSAKNLTATVPTLTADMLLELNSSAHSPSRDYTMTGRPLTKAVRLLGSSSNGSNAMQKPTNSTQMTAFQEQAELNDKRVEQLAKEKRELLSRSLEENKEKMEVQQKLVVMEKENTQLKSELRKTILEKERLERKYTKFLEQGSPEANKENKRQRVF